MEVNGNNSKLLDIQKVQIILNKDLISAQVCTVHITNTSTGILDMCQLLVVFTVHITNTSTGILQLDMCYVVVR